MATKGYPSYYAYAPPAFGPGGKPVYGSYGNTQRVGKRGDLPPQTPGFVTPQMQPREKVSVWAVWWNEFWGSLFFALVGRLFVAVVGGSVAASAGLGLLGNAFTNAFAFFAASVLFGSVSGGHFNPAITLAVWMIEFATYYIFGRRQFGVFRAADTATKKPIQSRELRWYAVWYPLLYPLLQFVAFLIAALLIWGILPGGSRSAPIALGIPFKGPITGNNGKIFGAEILFGFLLIGGFVILGKQFGSSSMMWQATRSMVFGFWYFVLILAFAGFAGGVGNPGLWLAFAIVSGRYTHWWIFLFPFFIAAILVAFFCWIHWWIGHIPAKTILSTFRGGKYEITLNNMPPGAVVYGGQGKAAQSVYNYAL